MIQPARSADARAPSSSLRVAALVARDADLTVKVVAPRAATLASEAHAAAERAGVDVIVTSRGSSATVHFVARHQDRRYVPPERAAERRLTGIAGDHVVALDRELLDRAATLLLSSPVRSLDAIYLATAQLLGADLRALLTYDVRMTKAGSSPGVTVEAPR